MFDVCMVCYPWDLEDEGIDRVLDRLQGELGVTTLCVAAAGEPCCQIRRREIAPRVFETHGGLFFQPDESRYGDTRCKPLVAEWLKARNPLSHIAKSCAARDIRLRAFIDTRRIGRLASRHSALAAKSMFNDLSPGRLCFSNPEVREFFGALIEDLAANYSTSVVELRYLDKPHDNDLAERADITDVIGRAGRTLAGTCFCESCRRTVRATGIDVDSAQQAACSVLNDFLTGARSASESLRDIASGELELAGYLEHIRQHHVDGLNKLARDSSCELVLHIGDRSAEAVASMRSAESLDIGDMGGDENDAPELPKSRAWTSSEIIIRADHGASPARLVSTLNRLAEDGVEVAGLFHYGAMPEEALQSTRQAVRFAKRTAGVTE